MYSRHCTYPQGIHYLFVYLHSAYLTYMATGLGLVSMLIVRVSLGIIEYEYQKTKTYRDDCDEFV